MLKKAFLFTILFLLIGSFFAVAQKNYRIISLDMGFGTSMGFFDTDKSYMIGFFPFAGVRYNLTAIMSVGAEAGIAFVVGEIEGRTETEFVHFPLRAVFRFGSSDLFAQGYAGYCLSTDKAWLSGVEFGAKVSIIDIYLEIGYVTGNTPHLWVAAGYALNDFFGF
ncbi:MAG: hypothetical protein JXB88_04235 [Spirochaetales bacterium]|nr:hypothetical protein [Spirochaetales bacterium]